MSYTIEEHQHRFAAWAASRAASVMNYRFSVEEGRYMLEKAGFRKIHRPEDLPPPEEIDDKHRRWRAAVIEARKGRKLTHGVAAKLINVYLKARFVCGGYASHERVKCLHPPIDRLLLDELARRNLAGIREILKGFKTRSWSTFDSTQYQQVIDGIRKRCGDGPLWEIEEYWVGYQ